MLILVYSDTNLLRTIGIHILTNILRSKSNQTMKFGQLIDNNRRNVFLEKSYTKCGGEIIQDSNHFSA